MIQVHTHLPNKAFDSCFVTRSATSAVRRAVKRIRQTGGWANMWPQDSATGAYTISQADLGRNITELVNGFNATVFSKSHKPTGGKP